MGKKTSAILVAAGLSLSLFACGDGGADEPDARPAPTIDTLCDEQDGIFVDLFATFLDCHPEFDFLLGGAPTAADLSAVCVGQFSPFIDDGTVVIGDNDAFDACAAYLATLDCDTIDIENVGPCEEVMVGQVADGDDCDNGVQCEGTGTY